jgi:hypothetical protein
MEELQALGYLQGSEPAPPERGVLLHRPGAWPGWNLAVAGHAPEAVLFDMEGRALHRWRRDFREVWPEREPRAGTLFHRYWRRAHLLPGGDLLVVFDGLGLVRLDRDSNVVWAWDGGAHHDLFVGDEGLVYVLSRKPRVLREGEEKRFIAEDFVSVLDARGTLLREVSLYEALARSRFSAWLADARPRGDIFHTNTIEVLDGRLAERIPAFRAGNVLVSIHGLHGLAVLDLERQEIVWGLRGSWRHQHQPTLLDSGRLLLFDNLGAPGRSRVLEVDPLTGEERVVHESPDFFSFCCGSSQRLPNGNTLVTESEKGRAFEIDPSGALVWDYRTPHTVRDEATGEEKIATLFEVERLPADLPLPWAAGPDAAGLRR